MQRYITPEGYVQNEGDPDFVVIFVMLSTDGGATWADLEQFITPRPGALKLLVRPDGSIVMVDGGYRTI